MTLIQIKPFSAKTAEFPCLFQAIFLVRDFKAFIGFEFEFLLASQTGVVAGVLLAVGDLLHEFAFVLDRKALGSVDAFLALIQH